MRICAYDIVTQCYNCLFTQVWGLYYQTSSESHPGYLRHSGSDPKFVMDRRYCLMYEYGADMLFTTQRHEVGLTKLPPCIHSLHLQQLSWKAWCHVPSKDETLVYQKLYWLLQCATSHRQITGLDSIFLSIGLLSEFLQYSYRVFRLILLITVQIVTHWPYFVHFWNKLGYVGCTKSHCSTLVRTLL